MQLTFFLVIFLTEAQTPLSIMEGWLEAIARVNPFNNMIRLGRLGFLDRPMTWNDTWGGLLAHGRDRRTDHGVRPPVAGSARRFLNPAPEPGTLARHMNPAWRPPQPPNRRCPTPLDHYGRIRDLSDPAPATGHGHGCNGPDHRDGRLLGVRLHTPGRLVSDDHHGDDRRLPGAEGFQLRREGVHDVHHRDRCVDRALHVHTGGAGRGRRTAT